MYAHEVKDFDYMLGASFHIFFAAGRIRKYEVTTIAIVVSCVSLALAARRDRPRCVSNSCSAIYSESAEKVRSAGEVICFAAIWFNRIMRYLIRAIFCTSFFMN